MTEVVVLLLSVWFALTTKAQPAMTSQQSTLWTSPLSVTSLVRVSPLANGSDVVAAIGANSTSVVGLSATGTSPWVVIPHASVPGFGLWALKGVLGTTLSGVAVTVSRQSGVLHPSLLFSGFDLRSGAGLWTLSVPYTISQGATDCRGAPLASDNATQPYEFLPVACGTGNFVVTLQISRTACSIFSSVILNANVAQMAIDSNGQLFTYSQSYNAVVGNTYAVSRLDLLSATAPAVVWTSIIEAGTDKLYSTSSMAVGDSTLVLSRFLPSNTSRELMVIDSRNGSALFSVVSASTASLLAQQRSVALVGAAVISFEDDASSAQTALVSYAAATGARLWQLAAFDPLCWSSLQLVPAPTSVLVELTGIVRAGCAPSAALYDVQTGAVWWNMSLGASITTACVLQSASPDGASQLSAGGTVLIATADGVVLAAPTCSNNECSTPADLGETTSYLAPGLGLGLGTLFLLCYGVYLERTYPIDKMVDPHKVVGLGGEMKSLNQAADERETYLQDVRTAT